MDYGLQCYTRFLHGDETGLEDLVREYGDSLVRFAYCFLKDSAAAEDVMEDTFTTLVVKRKKFEGRAQFRTYLFRIARNKCVDHLRARKRLVPLCDFENVLHGADPERDAMRSLRNETLYRCIEGLPAPYRESLLLFYFEGFSVAEISLILKKSRKQVYNLLARAKTTLKEFLSKEGINDAKL